MRTTLGVLAASTLILALAACQKAEEAASEAPAAEAAPAAAADASATTARREAAPTVAQLAYRYAYSITAPAKAVRMLAEKHENACMAAGPATCQVTGSSIGSVGRDQVSGTLSLRATPDWLARFRAGLPADVEAVEGKIESNNTGSADLSRGMTDAQASMQAQTVLRDRLKKMLAERPGKLEDVMAVENQLAAVQAQIDADRAELAAMRTRVAMSELTLSYRSKALIAPDGTFAPLSHASRDVVGLFVGTLALLMRLAAVLAPVGAIVAVAVWVMRRGGRRPAAARR